MFGELEMFLMFIAEELGSNIGMITDNPHIPVSSREYQVNTPTHDLMSPFQSLI
jgi:hypothetical protein